MDSSAALKSGPEAAAGKLKSVSLSLQENVPLAPLTTFKVGGPARYFAEVRAEAELLDAVRLSRERRLPLFFLGGGSNLVISDSGWPGLVVKLAIGGINESDRDGKRLFTAGAGEEWDSLVARAVAQDCAGIETLSGIPGSVGGTPVQNVGAYGEEVAETITAVRALDLGSLEFIEMSNAQCGFSYRTSIFNSSHRGKYVVTRVTFALTPGGAPRIEYADLKKYFAGRPAPTLQQTRDAVREVRLSKAMLIVPGDDDCRSAGSFFKNPIVSEAKYQKVSAIASAMHLDSAPPKYPAGNGEVKTSAAWLVERAGFHKGFTRGPVGISRRHSLAIVNRGGATAADILALKDEVQRGVREKFGIELHPEPVFVGFE